MGDMAFTLDLGALRDFQADLQRLPEVLQQRVVRGAVATGMRVVRDEAVRRAPIGVHFSDGVGWFPERLKRSIYMRRMAEKCNATTEVWCVDARRGGKNGAYYASMVELGHMARVSKKDGATRKARRAIAAATGKWVPPHPYLRPAAEVTRGAVRAAMQQYLDERIQDATRATRFFTAARR